jgi:hypothetical protein
VIQITPQMKVLVAVDPVDFRKGIDGLCRVARDELGDPWSGKVFVFRNRPRTAVKLRLECEIARHESGHYPEKIDGTDPFSGAPLVYKPDQGFLLSVGPDGREDTPADNVVWKLRQR